jgi:hypothetical protein
VGHRLPDGVRRALVPEDGGGGLLGGEDGDEPPWKRSKTYERAMWLFRLAEWYWVSTNIR